MPLAPLASLWKLTLAYDGSPYDGWQIQPGRRTVQGELATAIRRVTGEHALPQGSGRTDAGVHALAQVASFALRAPIPPDSLRRALNNILPASIRILAAEPAPPGFHARHSAIRKTYEYRLWRSPLCLPWQAPYVCAYTFPLSIAPMQAAAAAILGTHDFTSFQAQQPDFAARGKPVPRAVQFTVRTIYQSLWQEPEPGLLVYRVCGSGFLHHMVRNLVGTFLAVGRGQLSAAAVPGILAARARSAAGATAPASGLWLHSVDYALPAPGPAPGPAPASGTRLRHGATLKQPPLPDDRPNPAAPVDDTHHSLRPDRSDRLPAPGARGARLAAPA